MSGATGVPEKNVLVPIIMGSKRNYGFAKRIGAKLDELLVPYECRVASGEKSPRYLLGMMKEYNDAFDRLVYIALAGRSNKLGGGDDRGHSLPCPECPAHRGQSSTGTGYLVLPEVSVRFPDHDRHVSRERRPDCGADARPER